MKNLAKKVIKNMPSPIHRIPAELRQEGVRKKVVDKFTESNPKWWSQPKIFGIGLSKTGTTSLSEALKHLGYRSMSWKKGNKVIGWPEIYYSDAVTDTVCSSKFELLYYTFEKSKFIYTGRDTDSWERSIRNHFQTHYGVEKPSDFRDLHTQASYWKRESGWAFHNALRAVQIHESLYANHESWKEAYSSFEDRVRRFFEDKPNGRLLKMNIVDGDGWSKLCSFLDREIPDCRFPHENES